MNDRTYVREALIFFALVVGPVSVSARELGQTSRASISISVTVPPRLQVQRVRTSKVLSTGSMPQDLCVVTNSSQSTFSVTLVGPENNMDALLTNGRAEKRASIESGDQGSPTGGAQQGTTMAGASGLAKNGCSLGGKVGAGLTIQSDQASEVVLKQSGSLTFLIAPD